MRLALIVLMTSATSVLAVSNCKCQDALGQYNDATGLCCADQASKDPFNDLYYPGPSHQCDSALGEIDQGDFNSCCRTFWEQPGPHQIGGAFCWHI
ncbi:hypothetical protein PILCRDRAFT_816028 [Piloderma croceum F 1598]|uniref:Hydrophobin n=1 Tax=Piloderma croceum (strain F 1598) TaxID=765440 RepID=A0A0C3CAQ9_PILCF|nr:hypothetical protein PILCRDRAFT_816028 [Piloderma croceum F 1598]